MGGPGGGATQDAYELAVRALSHKERSTAELAAWLAERGVDSDDLAAVIDRLSAIGELDDERFARRFAEDKQELAGWGSERVREALLARGVAPEHIEAALGGEDEAGQLDRATSLLADRGLSCGSERERERALGLLVRRGYPLELAYEAVRAAERSSREAA
jgi:regulatory protein